jgi:DNA-binding NtrC family response regulator
MTVNVLLVDTDDAFRRNLGRQLRLKEMRVFEAEPGEDVRRILTRKEIDVVLLGLANLKREGMSVLSLVKKLKPLTQVIVLNRIEQISLSIESMKNGAFDEIMVPFDLQALLQRIRDAFQLKSERDKTSSLLKLYRKVMAAAAFAEQGEAEFARQILNEAPPQADHSDGSPDP